MLTRSRWFACSFLAVITLSIGAAPGGQAKDDSGNSGQVVVFRMHGELPESPPQFDFGFEMEQRRSLHDLLERFRKAKKDANVKAMVLTFDEPMIGWAQMQEIRQAIGDVRRADKDVYCYLEMADPHIYQLASAASKICLSPTGFVLLLGLHVEQVYVKGLLDKIGVEADIEHVGAYKGAGEPLTRTGPSDEAKEMVNWLVQDLYTQMVETIAEGRQIPVDEVRALIDRGLLNANEARSAKLVDEVVYAEDFVKSLKQRYGQDVEFVHDYGARKGPEIDFSSPFAIFKVIGEAISGKREKAGTSVAVVYVDGMIVTGKTEDGLFGESGMVGSTTLRRVLSKAARDETIKAVVLRVDSPGGSALASDIIWHATEMTKTQKPLIVSMGNVAASGGYYVSAGAGTIFADPATITGSIGVLGGKLITKGLWDWVGVTFHETQRGKNADLFNSNRRFDDAQRVMLRKLMDEVYADFTDRVRRGRGERLKKDLDQIAGGRVYTGRQALENGLVDRLGGLQDAIKFAAEQAGISDYDVRLLPESKNFMDLFMKSLTGQEEEGEGTGVDVSARPLGWTLDSPAVKSLLPALQAIDPLRARSVLRSLMRIEMLGREHTLMVLPGEIMVR